MAGDIFTLDADNNAAVRTVPVNAAASETNSPVIFTTDEDGNTAVRTVPVNAAASETNSPVIFTTDENGNAAVRVVGAGGGSTPVIDELNVTPSTSAQTITAPSGTDGYSPVNVAAVTSAIDANIVAENIKKDVEILGVTGSYEGQIPTGTKSITANGVYDVTDFASADVQVPTTAPTCYVEKNINNSNWIINGSNVPNLGGAINIGANVFYYAYSGSAFPANTSIDFSSLTGISGANACTNMFMNTTNIVSVDLSNVETITGNSACNYMFASSANLTSVDLSSLTTISGSGSCGSMFSNCYELTTVVLSSLTTINGSMSVDGMFTNAVSLKSIQLNALTNISVPLGSSYNAFFNNARGLERLELGGLKSTTFGTRTNQLQYIFNSNTGSNAPNGCTVHFPSNFDPDNPDKTFDITTLTGYPTFNGNASYIHLAYDLPATE